MQQCLYWHSIIIYTVYTGWYRNKTYESDPVTYCVRVNGYGTTHFRHVLEKEGTSEAVKLL